MRAHFVHVAQIAHLSTLIIVIIIVAQSIFFFELLACDKTHFCIDDYAVQVSGFNAYSYTLKPFPHTIIIHPKNMPLIINHRDAFLPMWAKTRDKFPWHQLVNDTSADWWNVPVFSWTNQDHHHFRIKCALSFPPLPSTMCQCFVVSVSSVLIKMHFDGNDGQFTVMMRKECSCRQLYISDS